ncbi:MAG: hypothetical protein LAO20_16780 [Acidobacteriia bacterium]|nr:hypothetical protein [Terriglobia bacterium]
MPKFSVKTPVRLDGDDYAPGESIELTAKQAAAMGEDVVTPIIETKTSGANGNGPDLAKLTKQELVNFAKDTLGLELDMALTKDEMLAAIETKKAEAGK